MNILDYIPEGHENAINLNQLVIRTGLERRKVRELIERSNYNSETQPIVNMMDGNGYFIPTAEESDCIKRYIISEKSRARNLERKIRNLEKYLSNIGQEKMDL